MLILSRMANENIIIGQAIEVTVLEIRGNRVVLGISAPRNIRVERGEKASERKGFIVETQQEVSMAADKEPDCNA